MRLLDRSQQAQRLFGGPGSDLVLEGALAAVEGEQGAGAVAAQVVQAHHAAMRRFAQDIEAKQRFGDRQRGGELARVFERAGLALERMARGAGALLALAAKPGVERRGVGELQPAEHAVRVADEVVADGLCQAQDLAALDQLAAVLAQAEQALAQRVAGRGQAAFRPQQLGQARPRVGPSSASQASSAASRGASALLEPSACRASAWRVSSRCMATLAARRVAHGERPRGGCSMVARKVAMARGVVGLAPTGGPR